MRTKAALLLAGLLLVPLPASAQASKQDVTADFVAPGPIVPLPQAVAAAVGSMRAEALAAHIEFLASASLEGRGLSRQGLEAAVDYVATTLALAGIRPAGPAPASRASYFQPVSIREVTHARGQLSVETQLQSGARSQTFLSGVDCVFPDIAPQTISGAVIFAGYGIREPSLGRDDYRDLDPNGKIVALLGGLPPGPEWQKPDLIARYGAERGPRRYTAKVDLAASLGARAVLVLEPPEFAAALAGKPQAPVPYFLPADGTEPASPPLVVATPAVARALLGADDASPALGRRALAGVTVTIHVVADERAVLSRNVVGVIPGADPKVRDEAIVLGAHMDHLGRSGDTVYPGADDNASGVAALLEIAKAYAAASAKPRRTIVFAFWTGEEEGHLGSDYYVRHPVWPLARTKVYANLDMIAHPWLPDEIKKLVADAKLSTGDVFLSRVKPADFVEPGVAESAPYLCPAIEQAARGLGLALHFDRTDGRNGGSDYRAFARKGMPFIRFFGNYFPGYHEPTDTPEATDAGQALKIAKLALATTWLLAER